MPASNMTGVRKWRFTATPGVVSLEATDFWLDYDASRSDDGSVELSVALRAVWERADTSVAQGRARRSYMEERLRLFKWTYVGQVGTLEVDYGYAEAKTFLAITLQEVNVVLGEFNDSLEYELVFRYPLSGVGGGQEIARTLLFGAASLSAQNFIVEYNREDRTVFKPIFRAAPVRVEAGPGLKFIRVTAIKEAVTGGTPLLKRQDAEDAIKTWANTYVGTEATLTIDGNSQGTCHLRSVRPSDLTLPDAVVYDLEFVSAYGS